MLLKPLNHRPPIPVHPNPHPDVQSRNGRISLLAGINTSLLDIFSALSAVIIENDVFLRFTVGYFLFYVRKLPLLALLLDRPK
jgi:hypothetical protein